MASCMRTTIAHTKLDAGFMKHGFRNVVHDGSRLPTVAASPVEPGEARAAFPSAIIPLSAVWTFMRVRRSHESPSRFMKGQLAAPGGARTTRFQRPEHPPSVFH